MTSIVAKGGEKSSSFPSVSVGVHKARCIKVIDLGTEKNAPDLQGIADRVDGRDGGVADTAEAGEVPFA